jgi:hypothetical protein
MEISANPPVPQGNFGDSSTSVPEGAEGICPACYHPFDSCQHCQVVGDLSPEDASAVVEGIAERLLAPVQRIVSEIRAERDELLAALKDASRTLKRCMSACAEKRTMGIQSQPCLVCRLNAAIAKAEER